MQNNIAGLYAVYGPCGREKHIAAEIGKLVKPFVDEVSVDVMGNLYAVRHGSSGKNVMISCPMDRPGLAVVDYNEHYLRGDFIGPLTFEHVHGSTAMFEDGTELPVRNTGDDGKKLFETSVGIDLRGISRQEKYLKTAQFTMLKSAYSEEESSVKGFGVSAVACCDALIRILKTLDTKHTVTAVFAAQSEIQDKGLGCAVFGVNPDACIELRPIETVPGKIAAGKGPAAEIPMTRRRGDESVFTATRDMHVQYLMMNREERNPVYGYKRDGYGYSRYFFLGLPVTDLKTKDECCLKSDIGDMAVCAARLIERM